MKMICWILLLIKLSCCVCAPTFEVKATQSFYQAEEKQNVMLEWTFPPPADGSLTALDFKCLKGFSVLFELIRGVQVSESEDEQFAGRVHCDTDVLKEGRLRLHMFSLRTEDSGTYECEMMIDGGRGRGESFLNVGGCSVHATVGDDVVLPVHIETKLDTSAIKVLWKLGDLVVHEWHDGGDYLTDQNDNFKFRTSMFKDEIAEGNVSLRLKSVTEEDAGTYTCTVVTTDDDIDYSVSLSVELRKSTNEGKDETTNKDQSGGLSAGVIVAIVGGCIVVVCIVGLICVILGVFLYKWRSFFRNRGANRVEIPVSLMKDRNECVPIHHPNQGQPGG